MCRPSSANVAPARARTMSSKTHAGDAKDSAPLATGDAPNDVPRRPILLAAILIAIALFTALDLLLDWLGAGGMLHLAIELAVLVVALLGAGVLARDLARARARTQALSRELALTHRDAQRYRDEATALLRGLGETIERQLDRWGLTEAEKEVAVLVLKGLSLKEVADVRGTSERTVRSQSQAVYAKAGLEGRAALSAFFLEDLLPPREHAGPPREAL